MIDRESECERRQCLDTEYPEREDR
jgi:hypothetical protein